MLVHHPEEVKTGTLARLRTLLALLYVFGVLGLATELLLLGHTEDYWQWVPFIMISISLLGLLAVYTVKSPGSLKAFRGIMLLFIAGGIWGTWLHLKGNMEFELEMYPTMSGFKLLTEVLTGATPALSPGAMVLFGLLGLLFTFDHPLLKTK